MTTNPSSSPPATDDAGPRIGVGADRTLHPLRTRSRHLGSLLRGPLPRLPAPLDRVAEGWWRLPPRARPVAVLVAVVLVLSGLVARARTSPWGPPVRVLVAAGDLSGGDPVRAVATTWPRDLVPSDHLATTPDGVATRPVRAGEVLTEIHVAATRSDLLESDEVALAIDRELGLPPGAPVDVLGTDFDGRGRLLGHGRMLAVDETRSWIAVSRAAAPAMAAGLASGQVTIALARGE